MTFTTKDLPAVTANADFILKDVRLSFPTLWEALEYQKGDGRPRWSAVFLLQPGSDNDKLIRAHIAASAKATFGDKWESALKGIWGQNNKCCYMEGDRKAYDGYAGTMALSTHRAAITGKGSKQSPPLILLRDKSPAAADGGKPYAGCYVNAKVSIYCTKGENQGVRASFSVVQFWRDGDAFGAAAPTADGFDAGPDDSDDISDLL